MVRPLYPKRFVTHAKATGQFSDLENSPVAFIVSVYGLSACHNASDGSNTATLYPAKRR